MDSITEILRKLKAGEEVDICDIYATVSLDGKQGSEQRLAALIAWVTNSAGSDSADALLADIEETLSAMYSQDTSLLDTLLIASGNIDGLRTESNSNLLALIDTATNQGNAQNTKLQSLVDTYALIVAHNRMRVEPLGRPTVRRVVAAAASSASVALTTTCRRASIVAVGADIRFEVSSGSPTASATTHLILEGERLDIHLPASPSIAATRNGSVTGSLEIMELEN
jgi:hypothetical protein